MSRLRRGLRGLQRWLPRSGSGLVILAYHLVGAGTGGPVDIALSVFRRQMEEIRQRGPVLPLDEALSWLESPAARTETAVAVTFDDAYDNFATHAFPVLEELGIPATLYVPVGFLDGEIPPPIAGSGLPPLPWGRLRELLDSGLVAAGSHTLTHPDLRRLSPERVRGEVVRSREMLEERLETGVTSFCYPRALTCRAAERAARSAYRSAVVAGGRKIRPGAHDLHRLSRFPLRRDMPGSLELLLTRGVWLEEWAADKARRGLR